MNGIGLSKENKIAVLIDGDNAESSLVEQFIEEAGRFGQVTVKRVYGDWTLPEMKSWKEQLNNFALRPMQKFAYTKGKGSTDTALIIDAMDILHSKQVQGFCIVSSDSDYTGIAHRIREEGMFIMGIGKSHTPKAFVKACESFTFSEILSPDRVNDDNVKKKWPKNNDRIDLNPIVSLKGIESMDKGHIDRAFQLAVDIDNGRALMSRFAEALRVQDPTFDHRNYGFASFGKFCAALAPNYEVGVCTDGTTMFIQEKVDAPKY